MSDVICRITNVLSNVVVGVPLGTNWGLLQLLWMMMSGRLLKSRGAIVPGLCDWGLDARQARRSIAALSKGEWSIETMLSSWEAEIESEGRWMPMERGGWQPVPIDLTAFYRPRLKNLETVHYYAPAEKSLPAIPIGMAARVGHVESTQVAIPIVLEKLTEGETCERGLGISVIRRAEEQLRPEEVLVLDSGFKLSQLREVEAKRFLIRVAKNFVASRNEIPESSGMGRPRKYGHSVRPLARTYRGKTREATPADRQETVQVGTIDIRIHYWDNLTGFEEPVDPDAVTFTCACIYDPRYKKPLLIIYSIDLTGQEARELYDARWAIETIPQTAKQMMGAHRQFVHAEDSRYRWPQLVLLGGSILSYLAATNETPIPTGFWDRKPMKTSGRFRRSLNIVTFPDLPTLDPRIRKKASTTNHLPKGIKAHRRKPAA